MHPEYRFPLGYNDIALSELSRRVIFDFDKYGDTPICSGPSRLLDGQKAITQGMEERSGGTVGWSRLGEFSLGSIHTWRQMFLGHFWPTYLCAYVVKSDPAWPT